MTHAAEIEHGARGSEWLIASHAFPELEHEARKRLHRVLGGIAVRGEGEVVPPPAERVDGSTLLSAIQLAALGDAESRSVIELNTGTDLAERLYKAGHQTKVKMKMVDGRIEQNGRLLVDIHRNTLENSVLISPMMRRTLQEMQNGLLFEELFQKGVLNTHDAVVFSTSPTDMSDRQKRAYGFFLDTETCSIQLLRANGSDLELQTALVAGKATPNAARHDIAAIHRLAQRHQLQAVGQDGTDMLRYVMLVPKSEVPHGVTDIVREYDDAAGGTFYGENKPRQDYVAYAKECENRNFTDMVQQITNQLIREAHAFASPMEAIARLDELSERLCVKYAINDTSINANIFGGVAAGYIADARVFFERGEMERGYAALRRAQSTADSNSCPLFRGLLSSSESASNEPTSSQQAEKSGKKWMKCPHCTARVFDDPCAVVLSCWDCSALVIGGRVKSTGNGGSKRRRQEAEQKRRQAKQQLKKQAAKVATQEMVSVG